MGGVGKHPATFGAGLREIGTPDCPIEWIRLMTRRRNFAEHGRRRALAARWRLAFLVCLLAGVVAGAHSLMSTTWAQTPADREAATSGPSPTDDLAGPPSQAETAVTATKKSSDK